MEIHLLNYENIHVVTNKIRSLFNRANNKRIAFQYHPNKFLTKSKTFEEEVTVLQHRSDQKFKNFIWVINPEIRILTDNRIKVSLSNEQRDVISSGTLIAFMEDYYFFYTRGDHLREYRFTNT